MKLLINLFIFMGLGLIIIAVGSKFFHTIILFPHIKLSSHLVFANTCFLIALILKLAKD